MNQLVSKQITDSIKIFYEKEDQKTADLLESACKKIVSIIHQTWELSDIKNCRIYIMTSWLQFIFHSAPWYYKIILFLTFPLWSFRAKRLWKFSAGWEQHYRTRAAIGIKPARLLDVTDKSVGSPIFVNITDTNKKITHTICHEMTHAFSAYLRLPRWLHEGIATVTVDKLYGQATIESESLKILAETSKGQSPPRSIAALKKREEIVYNVIRGYWITRFLEDKYPGLLKQLFREKLNQKNLEKQISLALNINQDSLWQDIDKIVTEHFQRK